MVHSPLRSSPRQLTVFSYRLSELLCFGTISLGSSDADCGITIIICSEWSSRRNKLVIRNDILHP